MPLRVKIVSSYGSEPKYVLREVEEQLNKALEEISRKASSMELHIAPITVRNMYGLAVVIVYEEE